MKVDKFHQIQEILFSYFEKTDDFTLSEVIKSFVFDLPATVDGIGEIVHEFLKANGLVMAFANYHQDKAHPEKFFNRSSGSEREMMELLKHGFLVLAYNRFKWNLGHPVPVTLEAKKAKPNPENIKFLGNRNIEKSTHVKGTHYEYTLCGILLDEEFSGKTTLTKSPIDCAHCKEIIQLAKKY